MAGQITKIRKRLKTVDATKKLTNATELVATVKLQKYNQKTLVNKQYAADLAEFIRIVLSHPPVKETNPFLIKSDIDNPLHIIIAANSGLCGSYNNDLLRYVEEHVPKDEPIFAIGTIPFNWLMKNGYLVIQMYDELEDLQPKIMNSLIDNILALYTNDEISEIDVIYTEYINTLTYRPTTMKILPLEMDTETKETEIYLEPDRDAVLNRLVPMYVSSQLYVTFLQAKTSENAARRNAMNNANRNADKLVAELTLSYNQARQAAITQEMNEISASIKEE